ncbi:hypothetical protein Tco_0892364 [Tanacetum coccineum]|uniref:Uncharacterized protein n=1 Tax=Tanacetum coccineum TaxID=301880 RepID=A0ABQ5C8G9_9ASTR
MWSPLRIPPFKCFLDAYMGYHLNPEMAKDVEAKDSLSHKLSVIAIQRMPFGLKNAGATYQRLVPIQVSRQVTPLVQNTQEVYEEGRLPLGLKKQEDFHAAQASI